jgi:hypothetical protein
VNRSQYRIGKLTGDKLVYVCTVKPRDRGGITIEDADGLTSDDQSSLMRHYGQGVRTLVRKGEQIVRRGVGPGDANHFDAASYHLPYPFRPMPDQVP